MKIVPPYNPETSPIEILELYAEIMERELILLKKIIEIRRKLEYLRSN